MGKVPGYFVGYRKFVVDPDWLRDMRERNCQKRLERFKQWSKTWITVTRLKETRLWTDWAIRQWLGQPKKQGKYKVFAVADVKVAERKKDFKEWHQKRLEKKQSTDKFFELPKL
ncbi:MULTISPECIES: hypothetical protein [Xenorhabdus]|uniref:Uncharacterized protein n=1 Tax=Xenorhabdus khoisanae TaxID=880157 RepID=A0A0J5FWV6_9GAMM|nr:hypothetical protein [Xenorhabdus khoisanae]KMJ46691.1 hypothetical protein AB204_02415 [Xenorhabdus khoisanae]